MIKRKLLKFSIIDFVIAFITLFVPLVILPHVGLTKVVTRYTLPYLLILMLIPLFAGCVLFFRSRIGCIVSIIAVICSMLLSFISGMVSAFYLFIALGKGAYGAIGFLILFPIFLFFVFQVVYWIFHLRFVIKNTRYFYGYESK